MRRSIAFTLGLSVSLLVTGTQAQDTRNERVRFPRGASGTTIEATIQGDRSVRYVLGVDAGQRMSVQLDTSNASNYFNITAPGASEALFNGSISGNGASVTIPSSGNYAIDVYLMRNAARRNETADYALTVYVENGQDAAPSSGRLQAAPASRLAPQGTPSSTGISTADMPRFCQGEASAQFGVRPPEITTNVAFRSGPNYVVQGSFDDDEGTVFFNCSFDPDGSFRSVN